MTYLILTNRINLWFLQRVELDIIDWLSAFKGQRSFEWYLSQLNWIKLEYSTLIAWWERSEKSVEFNSNRVSLVTEKTTTNLSNKIKIPWKCYNLCNQNPTMKNEQFKDIKGNWWSKIRYVILSHRRQLIRLNVVRELDSVEAVRGIVWFGNEGWLAAMK